MLAKVVCQLCDALWHAVLLSVVFRKVVNTAWDDPSQGHLLFLKVRRLTSCWVVPGRLCPGGRKQWSKKPTWRCSSLNALKLDTEFFTWKSLLKKMEFLADLLLRYLGIQSKMKKKTDYIIFSVFERRLCFVSSFVSVGFLLEIDDFWSAAVFQTLDSYSFLPDPFLQVCIYFSNLCIHHCK